MRFCPPRAGPPRPNPLGGGAVDLMAAIRNKGGKGLKKVDHEKVKKEKEAAKKKAPRGGMGMPGMAGGMNIGQLVAMKAQLRKERSSKLDALLKERPSEKKLKSNNVLKDGGNLASGIAKFKLRKTKDNVGKSLKARPPMSELERRGFVKR